MKAKTAPRIRWRRVLVAVILAEATPILLLFGIVTAYAFVRSEDSLSPEQFAPLAGNWVGPIGGFICTLLMARWAVRATDSWRLLHGVGVGVGAALLDLALALGMVGTTAVSPLLICSLSGRIVAGVLAGVYASKKRERR